GRPAPALVALRPDRTMCWLSFELLLEVRNFFLNPPDALHHFCDGQRLLSLWVYCLLVAARDFFSDTLGFLQSPPRLLRECCHSHELALEYFDLVAVLESAADYLHDHLKLGV